MNTKVKTMLQQLLQSPRRFPVELALGVAFFIIAAWDSETHVWDDKTAEYVSAVNSDILWFFVPLMALTFWLHRVNRWAYYASFFIFLPLMALDLKPFIATFGFAFTYVLAAILLIIGYKRMDNRSFAAHALHVATQMFFGLLISGILNLAVIAITASFFYIFGIEAPKHFFEHIYQFIWFVLAPQVCCTLIRQNEDEVTEPFKILRLILNFILSPAVIIYTVILYTYFIKIVLEWDLPKGGVAWMVMGFITVALVGRVAQSILSQRYYDWFYRHFTLIAIPPLIMYWIGSIYRIRLYSFTESRFYLMGRCADDPLCADVVPRAHPPVSAHGTYLRRGYHPLHLYPRHLRQEHRTDLPEAAAHGTHWPTGTERCQDGQTERRPGHEEHQAGQSDV